VKDAYAIDKLSQSFIFSLDMLQKMPLNNPLKAIKCS